VWRVRELPGDLLFELDGIDALPGVDRSPRGCELLLERLDSLVELTHPTRIAGLHGEALLGRPIHGTISYSKSSRATGTMLIALD